MSFYKVTRLHLGADNLVGGNGSEVFGSVFASAFGMNKETKREPVFIDPEKIFAFTAGQYTTEMEGVTCIKLYFSPTDYWFIEYNDEIKELFDKL